MVRSEEKKEYTKDNIYIERERDVSHPYIVLGYSWFLAMSL